MNEPNTTAVKKKNKFAEVWKRLCKNTGAVIGMVIILIFVLGAVFANLIRPYDLVIRQEAAIRLDPPSAEHWFGTDAYGRDVFARVLYGSRISLSIGFFTAAFSLIFGGILGAAGAYYGGQVDNIIMRVMDMFTAIPGTLLALAIVAALGTSMVNLLIAITISSIPGFVRLIRSTVLTVVESDYVEAARAGGAGGLRIILSHVLPNSVGVIIVNTTLNVAKIVIYESTLSFLGLGMPQPAPEWGQMLSEAREFMSTAPHLLLFPALAIVLTACAINLVGDGLRDALDPHLKS